MDAVAVLNKTITLYTLVVTCPIEPQVRFNILNTPRLSFFP